MSDYLDQIDREERDDIEAALRLEVAECKDRIRKIMAERDDYASKLMAANDTYTEMHLALEALQTERDAAVLAEREACARLAAAAGISAYKANKKNFPSHAAEAFDFGEEIADAIRARSNKDNT